MPGDLAPDPTSDYRLAPAVGARLVGGLLVAFASLLLVVTALVAWLGLPVDLLVAVAGLGLVAVFGTGYALTRRLYVVRLGPEGYRVRMVRGVGVPAAGWKEVAEAVTATRRGTPVVVLRLHDGRTSTIPVTVLAVDRERFVRDLQSHLQRGQGLRPL